MTNRLIHALDTNNDNVVDTFTETDDTVSSWNIPTIFPNLASGNYSFVMSTPETGAFTVLGSSDVAATGGTLTDITDPISDETYTGHIFREDGDLVVTQGGEVEVMLVGPGGSGGSSDGWVAAGAGAGGDVVLQTINLPAGTYPIVIGTSPLPDIDTPPTLGTATTAFGLTALPGGHGSGNTVDAPSEAFNASLYFAVEGGGGMGRPDAPDKIGAAHTTGFKGGDGIQTGGQARNASGGGRGAGGNGQDGVSGQAGDGGPGVVSGIDGTLKEYGRGGGGSARRNGWLGGAPNGPRGNTSGANGGFGVNPGDGGAGGHGESGNRAKGGSGGPGIVVVRYKRTGTITVPTDVAGLNIGDAGATGSIYDGFKLAGGDDFHVKPTRWTGVNLTGDYAHSQPAIGWRGTNGTRDDHTFIDPAYKGPRSELVEPLNIDLVTTSNSAVTFTARGIGESTSLEDFMPDANTSGHKGTDPDVVSGTLKTWPQYMLSAQADYIVECRIRVQAGVIGGYWPSFWTTTIFWPEGGEVDVVEVRKNPTTGVTQSLFVIHGEGGGGGHSFKELAEPIIPDDRWIHFVGKKVGGTLFMYDDIDIEGTLVQRVSSGDSLVAQLFGAHDIRMDLAISTWWDGSGNINVQDDYPAKVEFDWWRAWVPDTAARDNQPLNILPVIETTPGGAWTGTLPTTVSLFGSDPGLEQVHGAFDNFDAPGQPSDESTNDKLPLGMSFEQSTREVTGTVPTENGGATALMLTYAYDDGSPAGRVLQPYHVAPAVQELPAQWNVATGDPVEITIDFLDFHSGNLGPHTYDVTAPGLTVTNNGTTEVTITGTAPASNVTVTIDCTNTAGQVTTVTRDIVMA